MGKSTFGLMLFCCDAETLGQLSVNADTGVSLSLGVSQCWASFFCGAV
ncbi:hypothetical protein [Bifidobacterium aquikefiricola]|uniref:Uncharacterized protein n=1 Tax=Bifidobacterium aquikefiricola TaxID=3059038 RepID=A0AB39U6K0_9BIFI